MNSYPRLIAYTVVILAVYVATVVFVTGAPRQPVALLALGLGGTMIFALILVAAWSVRGERPSRTPWQAAKAEMAGIEQLAKTSAAQGEALNRERHGRRRAEEDSAMKEQLLAHSMDEKERLGRDLHDGLIQSLYAAGLTLESIRPLIRENPAEADRRLEKCLSLLNGSIGEVRSFITPLSPERLRSGAFSAALDAILAELRADREVDFDLKVDTEATALLSPVLEAEALQIVREAVSNALRHGGSNRLTIRLHRTDREVCLLVQDNGRGFDASRRGGGHGLGNMRARAEKLGGTLRIESKPGEGSRVVVTLPMVEPA